MPPAPPPITLFVHSESVPNFAVKYEAGNSFVALGGRFKRLLYLNGLLRQNGETQEIWL